MGVGRQRGAGPSLCVLKTSHDKKQVTQKTVHPCEQCAGDPPRCSQGGDRQRRRPRPAPACPKHRGPWDASGCDFSETTAAQPRHAGTGCPCHSASGSLSVGLGTSQRTIRRKTGLVLGHCYGTRGATRDRTKRAGTRGRKLSVAHRRLRKGIW